MHNKIKFHILDFRLHYDSDRAVADSEKKAFSPREALSPLQPSKTYLKI